MLGHAIAVVARRAYVSAAKRLTGAVGIAPTALWVPGMDASDLVYGVVPAVSAVKNNRVGVTYQAAQSVAGNQGDWSATAWDGSRGALALNGTTDYYKADALAALITGNVPFLLLLACSIPVARGTTQILWSGATGGLEVLFLNSATNTTALYRGGAVMPAGAAPELGRSIVMLRYGASKAEVRQLHAGGEKVLIAEGACQAVSTMDQFWLFGYTAGTLNPLPTNWRGGALFIGTVTQAQASAGAACFRDQLDCPLA